MSASDTNFWDQQFERDGYVQFHGSRPQMLAAMAGCLVFTVIGVLLATLDNPPPAARVLLVPYSGYLAIAFFGVVGIPVIAWRLISGRPHLRVDASGIVVDHDGLGWDDIDQIVPYRNTVVVTLTQQAYAKRRNGRSAIRMKIDDANRRLFGRPAWLASISSVAGAPPPALSQWLSAMHERYAND